MSIGVIGKEDHSKHTLHQAIENTRIMGDDGMEWVTTYGPVYVPNDIKPVASSASLLRRDQDAYAYLQPPAPWCGGCARVGMCRYCIKQSTHA